MTSIRRLVVLPVLALAAACGGDNDERLDAGLRDDLALAASPTAMPPMYMSPVEQGYGAGAYQQPYYYPAPTPVATRAPQPVYRAPAPVARAPQRAPAPEPIRNTKRDAVIGAAAGAIIGATTSRDRVKGAVIGAAAGGILGGIIGHTVDVQRPPY
jgi:hypothetical protein